MYTQFHFLEHVYAYSLPTHYFSCTRFLRFLPHPRCMGPLSALCRWKVRGEAANRVETKGFFLLRSHIGAISQTAVPLPGVPNSLTRSLFLSHPPCLLLIYENITNGMKGPTKVVQRRGDMFNQAAPPVYPVLGCSDAPSSSDTWDSRAVELSNRHRGCTPVTSYPDWADDFSEPTDLTHGGWVCA